MPLSNLVDSGKMRYNGCGNGHPDTHAGGLEFMGKAIITVVSDAGGTSRLIDDKHATTIGKTSLLHRPRIAIGAPFVAPEQGEIRCLENAWSYHDLSGREGTFINGVPLTDIINEKTSPDTPDKEAPQTYMIPGRESAYVNEWTDRQVLYNEVVSKNLHLYVLESEEGLEDFLSESD